METKRANMTFPVEIYAALEKEADKRHMSITALVQSFVRLGLMVTADNTRLIIKQGDQEREVVLI